MSCVVFVRTSSGWESRQGVVGVAVVLSRRKSWAGLMVLRHRQPRGGPARTEQPCPALSYPSSHMSLRRNASGHAHNASMPLAAAAACPQSTPMDSATAIMPIQHVSQGLAATRLGRGMRGCNTSTAAARKWSTVCMVCHRSYDVRCVRCTIARHCCWPASLPVALVFLPVAAALLCSACTSTALCFYPYHPISS